MSTMSTCAQIDQHGKAAELQISLPTSILKIGRVFDNVWTSLKRRRKLRRYLDLSDRILEDIGVTRDEVEWAVRLPLHENGALRLEKRAKARRAKDQAF